MPSREYRDRKGVLWEIFEVHRLNDRPNAVRPALSSGWLAFVSNDEKRRLPAYPRDWMQLSDDELQELLSAAFRAPDPTYPVPRPAGSVSAPADATDTPRAADRPQRPRVTTAPTTIAPVAKPEVASPPSVSAVSHPAMTGGAGLPFPPPPTVSASLGAVGIETLVRAHARQARQDGVAIIAGMIGVKRALADAGEDVTPQTLRELRKLFVDEFYFAR